MFIWSHQKLPLAQGLVNVTNCTITGNTSPFGGAVCCWRCRAAIRNSSFESNLALNTLEKWSGNNKMLGNSDQELYVAGVGGAVAAVFDGHRSFVVIDNETRLETNAAQMLGGAVYTYSKEKECNVGDSDKWDPNAHYGFAPDTVRACGVSFLSGEEGGNKASLGGDILAWSGQGVYKACCSSADSSAVQCSEGPKQPVCSAGTGADQLYATLPAQVVAYNTYCLDEIRSCSELATSCWFSPAEPVGTEFDRCVMGFSDAVDSRFNKTFNSWQQARTYSGWQLSITAIVIDGYEKVMNLSNPDQRQLVELVQLANPGPGQGAAKAAEWAANTATFKPPQLQIKPASSDLFVIGDLVAPLAVTAQFLDLALQPVVPPRETFASYNFTLFHQEGGTILRQVRLAQWSCS